MTRRPPFAPFLVLALVLAAAACGGPAGSRRPPLPEAPPVIEPVPETPVAADEGRPGVLERLPGVAPPVRDLLVEPEGEEPAPGILLVHAWWGLDPGTRDLARDLSAAGYLVVVPDLYEQVVATSRISARELIRGVAPDRARELLAAGLARLAAHPRFDGKAFALAVEQGGDFLVPFAAERAAAGAEPAFRGLVLDSTNLSLHEADLPRLGCPVLWLVGASSAAFDAAVEQRWKERAREGGVDLTVRLVPEAGAGLLDPRSLGYRQAARDQALAAILDWLRARR